MQVGRTDEQTVNSLSADRRATSRIQIRIQIEKEKRTHPSPNHNLTKRPEHMIHRAAASLYRRTAALAAPSSRGASSVAARAAATSARGVATASSPNTAAVSFAESSAIAPSTNGYCRNFSTAAADADEGSPWSDFPMAPPDPIIGLTEVRCMMCIFAVQQTCHFWHNKICAS